MEQIKKKKQQWMLALLSSPILFNHVDKKKKDRLHMRAGRRSDESGRTRISLSLSLAHIQTWSIIKKFLFDHFYKIKVLLFLRRQRKDIL